MLHIYINISSLFPTATQNKGFLITKQTFHCDICMIKLQTCNVPSGKVLQFSIYDNPINEQGAGQYNTATATKNFVIAKNNFTVMCVMNYRINHPKLMLTNHWLKYCLNSSLSHRSVTSGAATRMLDRYAVWKW